VTLRAFRDEEVDRLVEVRSRPLDDGANRWDPPDPERLRARVAGSGQWSEDGSVGLWLAIEADGRLVGEIQARSPRGGMPPGVFELGIELYEPEDRGRGLGSSAVAELTRFLFREEGAHRVQVTTDVANAPMRRVAERLGFRFEGVLRGFMPTASGPRDHALYAIMKSDWEHGWTRTD
jgi:RimJ/RimL family protein N-acetyltransferase